MCRVCPLLDPPLICFVYLSILFLGHCLLNAVRRVDFAGRDLTTELQTLLHEKGHDFISGGKLKQT